MFFPFPILSRGRVARCCAAICLSLTAVNPIQAQDNAPQEVQESESPPPWPEVRSKRVAVPKGGAGNLISVQIRPGAKTVKAPPAAKPEADAAPVDLLDWYWDAVPHDLAGAGASRFGAALSALDHDPGGAIPRPSFQHVTDLANRYGTALLLHSIGTKVSPALALAVIAVESSGDEAAVSGAGAEGLMQLIPATAERFGVDATDPEQNIKGGIAYLDWLLSEFNGDLALALAGYNAGENAVKAAGGPPPYAETRAYVPKVLAAWQVAKRLCVTPPDLYSDGCVFATNAIRAQK
ncbi:lytic transglycosylase domain-containing protein [Celeribacter halophilus]|uniref:Lytic transglycosylase domain-containing protein n=1 Tax=Celeribacter halophilus TaxID=576117 RepID=A0AAW7XQP1_9RHOB|nr:lytic transglycosylase domain-containing protein [Celeribacter halophilus]MDO6456370.1 lytic transglycosylase domain-containing protein [Celeribacter halophilus]MDO6722833.1 lytic transglycosylase domain-containing protein [Celeribacter halophilus]